VVAAAAPAASAPGQVQNAAVTQRSPELVQMDPAELEALKSKARKAASKRRWKTARKLAEDWMKADLASEPRLILARSLMHGGLDAEALEQAQSVLEQDPSSDEAKALIDELKKRTKAPARAKGGKMVTAHKR